MKLIILTILFLGTSASPMYQSVAVHDDGSYKFAFETGKDGGSHSRTEERNADGVVIGKYSFEDPNGIIREVSYRADNEGYVANGDVGVEGAPKAQFPVPEQQAEVPPAVPEEPKPEDSEPAESNINEEAHKEEDVQELPSEDSTANDPPEAFPQGFFLQQFQGLRRLPEPTKEESETVSVSEEPTSSDAPEEVTDDNETAKTDSASSPTPNEEFNKISKDPSSDMEFFKHLRPFQGWQSPPWSPSMLHQPVYVFSYQHPESYGYHYYY